MKIQIVERGHPAVAAVRFAKNFQGAVGKDLVHIHVRARPGAPLKQVDQDMSGKQAFPHFAGRPVRLCQPFREGIAAMNPAFDWPERKPA